MSIARQPSQTCQTCRATDCARAGADRRLVWGGDEVAPGPLGDATDGSGPLTMVHMKFEFWASVRAGKNKQTVWNCPASQFYEQLEDGSFVYSEATRDAVTRAKQVYKIQADAQKGRWSPIMHSTKCSSPWEPFVEFLEEADL